MATTVELVRFTVTPGQEEAFLTARPAAVEALSTMPGLLSATLARTDDGEWLDVVLWRSREEALAAAEAFEAGRLPEAAMAWASLIAEVRSMTHADVVHAAGELQAQEALG